MHKAVSTPAASAAVAAVAFAAAMFMFITVAVVDNVVGARGPNTARQFTVTGLPGVDGFS